MFNNRVSPNITQEVITIIFFLILKNYPEASAALIEDTFMDDTIVSHPSAVECVRLLLTLPKVTEGYL